LDSGKNAFARRHACAPAHGRRGEEDAYFYFASGYTIIARNYRSRIIAANSIWSAGIGTCCVSLK